MIHSRSLARPFNAEIWKYKVCKYTAQDNDDFINADKVVHNSIDHWEIWDGEDGKVCEMACGEKDDYGEYLVLFNTDGKKVATYRNSYCDMFRHY